MRKIESASSDRPPPGRVCPWTATQATLPRRATSITAPGTRPSSMCFCGDLFDALRAAPRRGRPPRVLPPSAGLRSRRTPHTSPPDDEAAAELVHGAFSRKIAPLYSVAPAAPSKNGRSRWNSSTSGIHDRAHPRQGAEVAMHQQPLVGGDLGQHAADPAQRRDPDRRDSRAARRGRRRRAPPRAGPASC